VPAGKVATAPCSIAVLAGLVSSIAMTGGSDSTDRDGALEWVELQLATKASTRRP
jgi:hypothetical protein